MRAYAFSSDTITDSVFFTPPYLVVLVEQLAPDSAKPAVGQVNIYLFASSKKYTLESSLIGDLQILVYLVSEYFYRQTLQTEIVERWFWPPTNVGLILVATMTVGSTRTLNRFW